MSWPYDYIVIQDCFLVSDVIKVYPDIINFIDKIGGNGKISVYKKLDNPVENSLFKFLGLDKQTSVFSAILDFEKPDSCWTNIKKTENNGVNCGHVQPSDEFGITLKINDFSLLSRKQSIVVFSANMNVLNPNINEANIVTSVDSTGKNLYYSSFDLKYQMKKNNSWQKINLLFNLPPINSNPNILGVYIWNKGKNEILYDSLRVDIY
jgi:hypothetical protein